MKYLVAAAALTFGTSLNAEALTGAELHELCSIEDKAASFACSSYIVGVWDGFNYGATLHFLTLHEYGTLEEEVAFRAKMVRACNHDDLTNEGLVEIAKNYLARTPEVGDFPAISSIQKAVGEAYPCHATD